jgi:hypothetical protein
VANQRCTTPGRLGPGAPGSEDSFKDHYERAAAPFQWTLTRQDLTALLAKPAAHDRLAAA